MRFGNVLSAVLLAGVLVVGLACSKAGNDSQVTAQLQTKLDQDSGLHGKPISIQAADGVITLSGTVDNDTQREAAARYASQMAGVRQVVNNLTTSEMAASAVPPPPATQSTPDSSRPSPKPSAGARWRDSRRDAKEISGDGRNQRDSTSASNATPDDHSSATAVSAPTPSPTPAPPPAPPKKVTVASGTSVAVRLVEAIDSDKVQLGDTFHATLDAPIPSDGEAVPSGYDVKGHVVDVKSSGKFAGQSLLVLELDSIKVGGRWYPMQSEDYRREGSNRSKNTAEKVGGGAILGAIIGGIAGGGKGAGIGAAAGGGLGGGAQAASKKKPLQLASETVLSFTLKAPLTVILPEKSNDAGRQRLDAPPTQ